MASALKTAIALRDLIATVDGRTRLRMNMRNYVLLKDLSEAADREWPYDLKEIELTFDAPLPIVIDPRLPNGVILVDTPQGPVTLAWDMAAPLEEQKSPNHGN